MEVPEFQVKLIKESSFFDVYNELSHRSRRDISSPTILIQSSKSTTMRPGHINSLDFGQKTVKPTLKVPELIMPHDSNPSPQPFTSLKRPPTELIAIEIPIKPNNSPSAFMSSSKPSPNFNSSDDEGSLGSYGSFEIPKIPKSIASVRSAEPEGTEKLQKMESRFNDLENREEEKDNEAHPLYSILKNARVLEFDSLLELIFIDCNKTGKTGGCLPCGKRKVLKEVEKLDYFYYNLGLSKFDVNKVIHRSLLKKYFFLVLQDEQVPIVDQWKSLGLPEDLPMFFQQNGAALAMILAIYIAEMIKHTFLQELLSLTSVFLSICSEIALETYQISKLSKMRSSYFSSNSIQNYFKLASAGTLNFYMVKLSSDLSDYEILQRTIIQMRENTLFLINSIDRSILKAQ